MRCYKGFWSYQGRVYPTLHAALLATWYRRGTCQDSKNALVSVGSTDEGGVERIA